MKTRLILTLLLILLAAVIAAAAIFFLLAQPSPPGDTGAGSPAPPSGGPSLTIVTESITNPVTGQAMRADVYLNGMLLRSLGKSVLHPQHYAAKRHCAPNWETNEFSLHKAIRCIPNSLRSTVLRCSAPLPGDGPYGRLGRDPRGCAGL